jgi:GNAT superfamily N-acetyltransferase
VAALASVAAPVTLVVRRREARDLEPLAAALLAQQPETRYPFRDPLPIPVERFLHADDALAAWTAELDGEPVGHVCRTGPAAGFDDAERLNAVCAAAHGCAPADLTWVNAFFVATTARRTGVGRALLDAVVGDAEAQGARPCLEVLSVHPAARALYLATGWRVVDRLRPQWLVEAAGDDGPDVEVLVR